MFTRKLLLVVFIVACLFATVDLTFFVLNMLIDLEEKWTEFFGDFLTDTVIAMLAWEFRKEKSKPKLEFNQIVTGKITADKITTGKITADKIWYKKGYW